MTKWPIIPLGEIASASGFKAGAETTLPVYSVTKHSGFVPSEEYFKKQVFSRDLSGYKVVRAGEFAYATIHLDEGSIGISPTDSLVSPMYTAFRVDEERIDPNYLLGFLKSPRALAEYSMLGTGSAERRKSIPFRRLAELAIPLPPLFEQQRIATILGCADALRAKRREALGQLTELRQSIFLDIFGDPTRNPKKWPLIKCGEICTRTTVGVVVKPASYYQDSGIPALRSLNIRKNQVVMDNFVYISAESNEGKLAKSRIWHKDIAIVRSGQPGTAAVVPVDLNGANAIDILIATPDPAQVESEYLATYLNSEGGRRMVLGESRGQIQQHLNVKSLKSAPIPLPPLSLQRNFVAAINQFESVEFRYRSSLVELDSLFASLQSRAFRGEL